MANVYYKILNRSISTNYAENVISDLQKELLNSTEVYREDLFDLTNKMKTKRNGLDIDSILKYYVVNQILKNAAQEAKEEQNKNKFVNTRNNNIKRNLNENKYYKLSGEKWVPADNISEVLEDGSYVVNDKKKNSGYVYKKTYSADDKLLSVQLIGRNGRIVNNKAEVIELMEMKKEFAQRFKYSGYSGNSNDFVAAILNKFSAPYETGYYMDSHYNLLKWCDRDRCFYANIEDCNNSPLLTDYEFENSRKVIRREYTGIR